MDAVAALVLIFCPDVESIDMATFKIMYNIEDPQLYQVFDKATQLQQDGKLDDTQSLKELKFISFNRNVFDYVILSEPFKSDTLLALQSVETVSIYGLDDMKDGMKDWKCMAHDLELLAGVMSTDNLGCLNDFSPRFPILKRLIYEHINSKSRKQIDRGIFNNGLAHLQSTLEELTIIDTLLCIKGPAPIASMASLRNFIYFHWHRHSSDI